MKTHNYSDTRNQRRIKAALEFCMTHLPQGKKKRWSQTQIEKYFGSSSNPIYYHLKEILLVETDGYKVGTAKEYERNEIGIAFFKAVLTHKIKLTYEQFKTCFTLGISYPVPNSAKDP